VVVWGRGSGESWRVDCSGCGARGVVRVVGGGPFGCGGCARRVGGWVGDFALRSVVRGGGVRLWALVAGDGWLGGRWFVAGRVVWRGAGGVVRWGGGVARQQNSSSSRQEVWELVVA